MLLMGQKKTAISIMTPAGIPYETDILDISIREDSVSCAVKKDAGDDPDVTDGILIYATATLIRDHAGTVIMEGGEGVGIVTRPGLDQEVGNHAINSIPRKMIREEVESVMELLDCKDSIRIVISVPEGEEIAKKTFNQRLGIEGGISIIGTSGIVEPMSTRAIIETIRLELTQKREEGEKIAVISPGNYGLQFMRTQYGYDLDRAVKCANYIGETIDIVRSLGFSGMLLAGHVGKLIKLSGGIMNTHSKEADCRMELMAVAAFHAHADEETIRAVLDSVSTEEAYAHLVEAGIGEAGFHYIMDRIAYYLQKRAGEDLNVQCIVYSNRFGLLGKTDGAEEMLKAVKEKAYD